MPDVVFRDLCLDANRPDVVGAFWAPVLGLEVVPDGDDVSLVGAQTVWVNGVPERQSVKNRVHLDVRFDDPSDVPGATVVREQGEDIRWRVLADPDGLQFCACGPGYVDAPPGAFELVVDSADPAAIAGWWAERFGVPVRSRESGPWTWLEGVPGFPLSYWVFNPVPEPKTVKNRVHWDVDLADASLDDLVAAGATVVRACDAEIRWTVLADPEGNEFCAFAAD